MLLYLTDIKEKLKIESAARTAKLTGLSRQTVSDIRSGRQFNPRYSTVLALSNYINSNNFTKIVSK